jgi:hypothetical protein
MVQIRSGRHEKDTNLLSLLGIKPRPKLPRRRMVSSGLLRRVALVRTNGSEEPQPASVASYG